MLGLTVVVIVLILGACSESAPLKAVSLPPQEADGAAEEGPVSHEAATVKEDVSAPDAPPDPALMAAIEDINARWARVKTLRARLETTTTMMASPDQGGTVTARGVYEYEQSGEFGLYRAEMAVHFEPLDAQAADADATPSAPQRPGMPAMKLLHVYNGQHVYLQTSMSVPAPDMPEGAVNHSVIRGAPEDMGALQLPGAAGSNLLARYQKDDWMLRLLPDAIVEDRPVYVIEATAPPEVAGLQAMPAFSPGGGGMPGVQHLHFDKDTGVLVKTVHYAAPEQPAATTILTGLEYNAVIDPAHFVYDPPEGVAVRDAKEIMGMFGMRGQ